MAPLDGAKQPKLPVQQLAILSVCRFAEPVALTGVFPYLPEMIESFNVPKNEVPQWAGTTSMVFSLAQAVTSIQWGRASDRYGRKPVILIALTCAMLTSLLFGFSQSLTWAIIARTLAGASNGNVGILRTVVAELVPQRSLQPVAFSIMPMMWAIGSSFGPILGGSLAVPTRQFPALFGGNAFFEKYKFALPNLVASVFFTVGIVTGFLFLRETLETKQNRKDYGLILGKNLAQSCTRRGPQLRTPATAHDEETVPTSPRMVNKNAVPKAMKPPGWNQVFTYQSTLNVICYTILAFHAVTFDQMVPAFLHLPYEDHIPGQNVSLPFKFAGGFGLDGGRIGLIVSIVGVFGIVLQFSVFPPVTKYFGSLRCFRFVTAVAPLIYIALPYTVLLKTDTARQTAMFILMIFNRIVSVFAFPCTTILLTNSASSVHILGTLNGVAVATSAIGRATGPFSTGILFTWSEKRGYVTLPWFMLAIFAVLGHISTWWLVEMDGPSGAADADTTNGDEDDDEEIVLLPNDNESNAGQATGVVIPSENDQLRGRGSMVPNISTEYREPQDDEDGGEDAALLGSVPIKKTNSRDSRINFGGTSLSRRSSSTHMLGRRASTSPAVARRDSAPRGRPREEAASGANVLGLTFEEQEQEQE